MEIHARNGRSGPRAPLQTRVIRTTLALKSNATGTLADLDDTHIGNSSTFVITGSYLVR